MSILRRSACRLGRRGRKFLPCTLESLEIRLALSASSSALGPAISPAEVYPTYVRYPVRSTELSALASSRVQPEAWGSAVPYGMTPAQIREAYGINNITLPSGVGDGAGQTIAIVSRLRRPRFRG